MPLYYVYIQFYVIDKNARHESMHEPCRISILDEYYSLRV